MTLALGLGQCLHATELSSDRQRADLRAHLLTNLVHVLGHRGLPDDRIVGTGSHQEPKPTDRRLLCGAPGAVTSPNFTNFVEIPRPGLGIKRGRWLRAELRA